MPHHPHFWKIIYAVYPPVLRTLEYFRVHSGRQPYSLGKLSQNCEVEELKIYLLSQGFESAILAWRDSDEVLSLRKVHKRIFQWHIRLYSDGEIRGHYEYSSEGNPIGHIFESAFRSDSETFARLLGERLVR